MKNQEFIRKNLIKIMNLSKRKIKSFLTQYNQEDLHDIRVSIRKIRTLLKVLEKIYDPFYIKTIRDDLKIFFEKTSELRDLEVSISFIKNLETINNNQDLLIWLNKKKERELNLRSNLINYLKEDPLNNPFKLLNALLILPLKMKKDQTIESFITKKLEKIKNKILTKTQKIYSNSEEDIKKLHRIRILCKRLRYTIEFFKSLLPPDYSKKIKITKKIQTILGNLNDLYIIKNLIKNENELNDYQKSEVLKIIDNNIRDTLNEANQSLENFKNKI